MTAVVVYVLLGFLASVLVVRALPKIDPFMFADVDDEDRGMVMIMSGVIAILAFIAWPLIVAVFVIVSVARWSRFDTLSKFLVAVVRGPNNR